jgi:short-subunit dehydrogenase
MSKSILITGASSGIGKALSYELARKSHPLALTARRIDELKNIRNEIRNQYPSLPVEVRQLDVTEYETIPAKLNELSDALGGLDIVFANAGIALGEKIGNGEFDKARHTIETNLIGAMATVDAAVAYFLKRGKGHIVGTCSVAAFRGMPRSSSYSASKAGFAVYLEALRAEVYRKNIDVTVLYPGFIDTPLNNMLPNRPFLISAEKGAALIARLIERKVKSSSVPVFPWSVVGRLLKILPTGIISKL